MRRRRGFSLIELMIVLTIMAIVTAAVAPVFSEHIKLAHETAAIEQIRTIHTMQAQYYSQFGHYATSLSELGPPPAGAGLIPRKLADGGKGGYHLEVHASPGGYSLTAIPEAFGKTGRRTFFSDETNVIRQNWSRDPANAESPEM